MSGQFQRYLVTGGAGFIGRRVVQELLADPQAQVNIVDNLSVGLPMPESRARLTVNQADIRDTAKVSEIFEVFSPEVVIHLAAVHHIPTCEMKRVYSLDVNVLGTENLLESAARSGVQRFVLASSGAVYDWNEGALDEDSSPLKPTDNYSLAKQTNEMQLRFWADRTSKQGLVARIFNTIGADDPNAHLIPDIISQIPAGSTKARIALGNLSPRRDYIHVADTARAIAAVATSQLSAPIETLNISSGKDVSVGELVELLGDAMGVTIDVREDVGRKRRVDRPRQLGSPLKMRRLLDFEPRHDLREALVDIAKQSGWTNEEVG